MIGSRENFFIHEGYASRLDNFEFDDRANTNEFQESVYQYARKVYDVEALEGVCDFGCGSGFKLVEQFPMDRTLGIDVPCIVAWLRDNYPDRDWRSMDLAEDSVRGYDLVICSDVVEHLINPDLLMDFLARMRAKVVIISTPERDLLQALGHESTDGPPKNAHHVREWNQEEFEAYVGAWFKIAGIEIVDNGTQIARCNQR